MTEVFKTQDRRNDIYLLYLIIFATEAQVLNSGITVF